MNELNQIVEQIRNKKSKTIFVAIDGFGGSGKSTLANKIASNFKNAVVVSLDDFYSPEQKTVDRKRVVEQVIKPLKSGKKASYQRYDWLSESLKEWTDLEPEGIIILEGISSLHPDFDNFYDLSIWMDVSQEDAAKRGIDRDMNQYGVENKNKWENIWMPLEKEYVSHFNPKQKADFILKENFS